MAGCLAVVVSESVDKPALSIRDQWQVSFSRFVVYPSLPSTCPSLVLPQKRYLRSRGTWLSSCSSTASLQLFDCQSSSDVILSIYMQGKILEEHFVSKLHYTWPQLSCVSGYPARGSRSVFVSYKDAVGEIQKFAMRFSDVHEADAFISNLKDILKYPSQVEPVNSDIRSEISSLSVFKPSTVGPSRASVEEVNNADPVQTSQLPPSFSDEQESCDKQTPSTQNYEDVYAVLPPSFTSLISNCSTEVKQDAAQPSSQEEFDLKSQIAKYMEDSSFQDMLMKVEKVIHEIGHDFVL